MRIQLFFFTCLFQAAWLPSAEALTYYVAPNGNGSGAGTSRDAPSTPAGVLGKVAAGDVVVFLDGVYGNALGLTRSGSSGSPITLRADEGAVPIIRGTGAGNADGLSAHADVSHYVIEGLWFENWGTGGVGLDWDNSVSNVTIRYCVADSNLRNGFSPYYAADVTLEYNIASRNGWGPDSWSSNFNLFAITGSNNVVRGNVAFHGVDTSSERSDGNGFIVDLTIDQGAVLLENNLAFMNGGACIAVTDSGEAKLVGNTCYSNSRRAADYMDEFNFGNTCRAGDVSGVPVDARPYTFTNLVLRNNVAVPTVAGKDGVNTYSTSPCGGPMTYVNEGNYIERTEAASLFQNAAAADLRPKAGSALIDKVTGSDTHPTDIGFDPKCIKTETDQAKKKYDYWAFAPDLAYIKSVGGIRRCFSPVTRPTGSSQDLGAYELGSGSSAGGAPAGVGGRPASAGNGNGGNPALAGMGGSPSSGPPAVNDEEGGCGCRTAGAKRPANGAIAAALVGLGLLAGRRRRKL
jgi:MYXO-CTERM domain-containing protein